MATAKTAAKKTATKDASDTMAELMKQKEFKALLSSMVAESAATIAADLAAEEADKLAAEEADKLFEDSSEEAAKLAELDAKLAELDAKLAAAASSEKAAVKAAKKAAAAKADPICYVPQDIKRDRATGDALTGKRAGVWPAKFGITPDKFSDKRPTWVNAEIVRTILDNLVDARAVLKQCDSANSAE